MAFQTVYFLGISNIVDFSRLQWYLACFYSAFGFLDSIIIPIFVACIFFIKL